MLTTLLRRGALIAVFALPGFSSATPVELVIFGDSLSDTGNMFGLSGGFIPPSPPYGAGRFSNGGIWVDHLSSQLGLGAPNNAMVTATLTGVIDNFAAGGAYTGSFPHPIAPFSSSNVNDLATLPAFFGFPGLQEQVSLYTALSGSAASTDAWNVIWAGANDLVFADLFGTTADAVAPGAVANIRTAIEDLEAIGATDFLVMNLPDIGLTPFSGFGPRSAELSLGTDIFNAELALMLDDVAALLGLNITLLDIHTLLDDLGLAILADPVLAGFPGGFGPCLGPAPTFMDFCPGADPNDFLFWDALHPSSRAQLRIWNAIAAAKGIPEPGSLALVALGLIGVIAVVRKRAI